jgi:hypothetical protein
LDKLASNTTLKLGSVDNLTLGSWVGLWTFISCTHLCILLERLVKSVSENLPATRPFSSAALTGPCGPRAMAEAMEAMVARTATIWVSFIVSVDVGYLDENMKVGFACWKMNC